MFPLTVRSDQEFFNYHIGDGLEEFTLCRYIPKEIDNINDTHTLINQQTQKFHIVNSQKLREEFGRNPLDAAILFKERSDLLIKDHLEIIEHLQEVQRKAFQEARLLVSVSKEPQNS